jgi:hypothetical protein
VEWEAFRYVWPERCVRGITNCTAQKYLKSALQGKENTKCERNRREVLKNVVVVLCFSCIMFLKETAQIVSV